ncbi:MAG: hypothetical protein AB7Q29_09185 [Vicinamibacterales bacterium]
MARVRIRLEPERPSWCGRRANEPITVGVPFPLAALRPETPLAMVDEQGALQRVQTRILEQWADGSVRWMLVHFQANTPDDGCAVYWLEPSGEAIPVATGPTLHVIRTASTVLVDSGAARFEVGLGTRLLRRAERDGARLERSGVQVRIEDADEHLWPLEIERFSVEDAGALTATIRLDGHARLNRQSCLEVTARLAFFAGSGTVRFALTLRNTRPAVHPGGFWDLGDRGSVRLRDLAVWTELPGEAPVTLRCSAEPATELADVSLPFELYQESSGGAHWRSTVHVNRDGVVPHAFCGYRIRAGGTESSGPRATPLVHLEVGTGRLTVAVPQFWQTFPKTIAVDERTLSVGLLPSAQRDGHELQGGEQKTDVFAMAFTPDTVTAVPLDWLRNPLIGSADPDWCSSARAMPVLTAADTASSPEYVSLVSESIEGPCSFAAKREAVDEFGWRHFGDIYADHEAVGHAGPSPLVSHYNNQYDAIAGYGRWFLRTGDRRWWALMQDLAAHVRDIDIYHTGQDKAAYSGGMFWHTYHYRDAGRATHRAYPRGAADVPGGGPSPEHCYTTGLLLDYLMTGNEASREAVLGLADWILRADDGRLSRFRWLDRGATGIASSSGNPLYHGPGRGGANAISTLLDAHRLSHDVKYLQAAEGLIRRCIHPAQDIEALDLLDAERRWYYTMFLQSLAKYLEHVAEQDAVGPMYAYARASLLHFARWMIDHERPYLDHPEILEYPNETWAAQDMRKAEVFFQAAAHATGQERARLLERGEVFFKYSVDTLQGMPTHTLARPLVLLLSNGASRDWFAKHGAEHHTGELAVPSSGNMVFPPHQRFEPQKVRALRRLKRLVALAAVVVSMAAIWLLIPLLRQ